MACRTRPRVAWAIGKASRAVIVAVAGLAMALATGRPAGANGSTVETGVTAASPLLGRSIRYTAYLPAGMKPGRRYPVLYLLHGRDDDERAWLEKGRIHETLDRMIGSDALQPVIVVLPNAANSWYVDDARPDGYGPVARAFTTDLVAAVDARYPTAACAEARAVAGLSMGGYGAALFAIDRPDLFSSVISLSGSLFSDRIEDIRARSKVYDRIQGGVHGSPLDAERFRDWTVFHRLARAAASVRRLAFWLAAGDDDFPSIVAGTVRLHQELRRMGIASELRIDDGAHTWALWSAQIVPALAWLAPRLQSACAPPAEAAK